ncbi:MAG: hypothetical protein WBA89_05680 [Microcoleus sp.]
MSKTKILAVALFYEINIRYFSFLENFVVMSLSVGFNSHLAPFSRTGCPACSTKDEFSCGVGILPAHKKLVDNGASQFQPNASSLDGG